MTRARPLIVTNDVGSVFLGPFALGQTIDTVTLWTVSAVSFLDTLDIRFCSSPSAFDGGSSYFEPAVASFVLATAVGPVAFDFRRKVDGVFRYVGIRVDTRASGTTFMGVFWARVLGGEGS